MVSVDRVWTGLPEALSQLSPAMIVLSVMVAGDAAPCFFRGQTEPTLPWEDDMPTSSIRASFGFPRR